MHLKEAGTGVHLFKIVISRAFRHIKIDLFDFDLLGLKWRDIAYFDTCHLGAGTERKSASTSVTRYASSCVGWL